MRIINTVYQNLSGKLFGQFYFVFRYLTPNVLNYEGLDFNDSLLVNSFKIS